MALEDKIEKLIEALKENTEVVRAAAKGASVAFTQEADRASPEPDETPVEKKTRKPRETAKAPEPEPAPLPAALIAALVTATMLREAVLKVKDVIGTKEARALVAEYGRVPSLNDVDPVNFRALYDAAHDALDAHTAAADVDDEV